MPGLVETSIATVGTSGNGVDRLLVMNPRYRRMVIPAALVALILIVAVTALLRRG
jgi:uncharacterized protein involved in exopolysaccharide biosynthesis